MLNMKMILMDGSEVYPVYLSEEDRKRLKEFIGTNRECMWCGCREDIKLYYRISEDLRFYPEHQGYEHTKNCTRFDLTAYRKRTGYVLNEENGTVTAHLKFNPLTFTIPKQKEKEERQDKESSSDNKNTSEEQIDEENKKTKENKKEKKDKDPFLSLSGFIRHLNIDTYNERIINGGKILSHEYFTSTVFSRMKHVTISGLKKPIRSLTLQDDNVQFFYTPYNGSIVIENGARTSTKIKLAGRDGKEFNYFIFERTLRKAEEEFIKMYGVEPSGKSIMAAGFQYNMTKRDKSSTYRVIGRLHLFLISDHGLYCRSLAEQQAYNVILHYVRIKGIGKIRFIIPLEDDSIAGIFEIKGTHNKGVIRLYEEEENDKCTDSTNSEVILDCNILKAPPDIRKIESFIRSILIK